MATPQHRPRADDDRGVKANAVSPNHAGTQALAGQWTQPVAIARPTAVTQVAQTPVGADSVERTQQPAPAFASKSPIGRAVTLAAAAAILGTLAGCATYQPMYEVGQVCHPWPVSRCETVVVPR